MGQASSGWRRRAWMDRTAAWAGETEFFIWQPSTPSSPNRTLAQTLVSAPVRSPPPPLPDSLEALPSPSPRIAAALILTSQACIPSHQKSFHNGSIPHASRNDGVEVRTDDSAGHARVRDRWVQPVFLLLLSKPAQLRVLYDLRFVNKASGLSSSVGSCLESPRVVGGDGKPAAFELVKRSELEGSGLLQDDCLVIECDLTVIKETLLVDESAGLQMPPSNLSENLGNLLKTGEEADVTFQIQGELFPVHKIVLAMRSPVFKAQLYGPMRDKTVQTITVEDMQPAVFSAFLHFIYTDLLPSMEDLDDDEKKEMVKHLLVAADRYAIERLKMMCEGILCKNLDVESVGTMLALADQHQCIRLTDACIQFLMSSYSMDDGIPSQLSVHLNKLCPAVLCDILERLKPSLKNLA